MTLISLINRKCSVNQLSKIHFSSRSGLMRHICKICFPIFKVYNECMYNVHCTLYRWPAGPHLNELLRSTMTCCTTRLSVHFSQSLCAPRFDRALTHGDTLFDHYNDDYKNKKKIIKSKFIMKEKKIRNFILKIMKKSATGSKIKKRI